MNKYVEYIKSTGDNCKISWFDEDWEPIGPTVRDGLIRNNLAEYDGEYIRRIIDNGGSR